MTELPIDIIEYWLHPDGESYLLERDDRIMPGTKLRIIERHHLTTQVKTVAKIAPCETHKGTYMRIWMAEDPRWWRGNGG